MKEEALREEGCEGGGMRGRRLWKGCDGGGFGRDDRWNLTLKISFSELPSATP